MKRYRMGLAGYYDDQYPEEYEDITGKWITLADYLALQAALREALDMLDSELMIDLPGSFNVERSAALRAQFLDEGAT